MYLPNMHSFTDLLQYPEFVDSFTPEQRRELVRAYRTACLMMTDWTQLPDTTADKPAWAAYRQQLRDIMATYDGTSTGIVWPTPPSTTPEP